MTYKQIEGSREFRLWVGQIIIPAVGVGVLLWTNPNVQTKLRELKSKLFSKKQKSKGKMGILK